ncbi:MAG TPA: NAD-dependent epimerase/dehydratase family protein [Gaiellales bacterium]
MTKVLITGGAGFIGSHLTERLLAAGDEVVVVDNFSTSRRDSLTPHDKLTVVEGTIADPELVAKAFAFGPELVVHAAASYKDPAAWAEDSRTNVVGSSNVVQAAEQAGAGRIIYLQTALCYGIKPLEQPITLSHPLRPYDSSYAISKTAGEHYVQLGSVPSVSFRLANVYGPRNLSGPLPTFFHRLTNDKPCFVMDTRRDFVFVDDLVDLLMIALSGTGEPGAYHASSGSDFSIQELYDATIAALGLPAHDVEVRERGEDDAFSILLDPAKTIETFGWTTSTPLVDGVAKAIAWYREYGVEQTFTHLKLPEVRA